MTSIKNLTRRSCRLGLWGLVLCLGCTKSPPPATDTELSTSEPDKTPTAKTGEVGSAEPTANQDAPATGPQTSADEQAKSPAASPQPPSAASAMGGQAFREAAHDGQLALVRKALQSGTPVDDRDPQQKLTALHMAAYNGHTEIVRLLIDHDAEIDPRDHQGMTPLLHACTGPFPETVTLLINAGADINARESSEGFTPLMMAAGLGQAPTVKLLLEHEADKSLRDVDGDQAIDHARNSNHGDIVALLSK